jgi:hypothetical protein
MLHTSALPRHYSDVGSWDVGLELQRRLRTVTPQGVGGSATAWQSMGCAETVALTLPGDQSQTTHQALAQPSSAARGPRRSLAAVTAYRGRFPWLSTRRLLPLDTTCCGGQGMCLGFDVGGQPRRSADHAAGHGSGAPGGDPSCYGPGSPIRQCGLAGGSVGQAHP